MAARMPRCLQKGGTFVVVRAEWAASLVAVETSAVVDAGTVAAVDAVMVASMAHVGMRLQSVGKPMQTAEGRQTEAEAGRIRRCRRSKRLRLHLLPLPLCVVRRARTGSVAAAVVVAWLRPLVRAQVDSAAGTGPQEQKRGPIGGRPTDAREASDRGNSTWHSRRRQTM